MRREVSVTLSLQQEYRLDLEGQVPMRSDEARQWLDAQFVALECEPLRASDVKASFARARATCIRAISGTCFWSRAASAWRARRLQYSIST